jgi:predicted CopG family antitoxin
MTKTMKIRDETHRKLASMGAFGETFDDVISRLLDVYDKYHKKK